MVACYRIEVIDDDPAVLEMACCCLRSSGDIECAGYRNAAEFLSQFEPGKVDCIVADLRMPQLDGGELQKQILERDPLVSFVFVTGFADVRTAVRLMEQGAFTLLEKPFLPEALTNAALAAAERTRQRRSQQYSKQEAELLLGALTDDEYKILECVMAGLPNKAIAHQLTLASRTVDRRRQSILQKLKVKSVAELAATVARCKAALQQETSLKAS